ncbi:glycosyl transferase family 2 [Priestia aryabhattai]|uniref:glycosyltransferase n=1 Tax=Priestia aryabhattai TaxID=412384 RepID=UPI000B507AE2|nr:glycosyltransferase [Priestia aryabhattai]OVE34521.1 glycosyl transferase family 2 [Priestia aryabhattai]
MLKVSVIVPFFNCPFIADALDSLLNQTYNNIEIIVINDGSTQYKEKIIPYLDKIIYIEKENGGTASALNLGIRLATGDYICWLSSDDIFFSKKIALQLEFMKINNSFFSHTNYYAINTRGRIITPPLGFHPSSRVELLSQIIKGNIINGCSTMIKKNVFSHLGIFDEKLLYTHDYDLWLRIIQKFDLHYLSEPLLLSRIHKDMGTKKYSSFIKEENKTVIKHHKANINRLIVDYTSKENQ